MDRDKTLITTATAGAIAAALCCATPLLAVVFGALGLTAWLAKAGFVAPVALAICLGLLVLALARRRRAHR